MCIMITIFVSPLLYYYSYNEIQGLRTEPNYDYNQFTLGNLGGAGVYAGETRVGLGQIQLTCLTGNIIIDDETKFGIMGTEVDRYMHYTEESILESLNGVSITNCTNHMDKSAFRSKLLSNCNDLETCIVELTDLLQSDADSDVQEKCGDHAHVYV